MSRIILTTLGSLGDLHPLIAIGLKLREHGHFVVFSTCASFHSRIEALGFEFQALRPDVAPENPAMTSAVKEIMDPKKGADRLLRGLVFPQLRATYDDLLKAVTGNGGADLLVSGELVYPAPLVAEKTGVRWASCVTAPMSFFSAFDPPVLPPFPRCSLFLRGAGLKANQGAIKLVKYVTRNWSQPVRELRAELGLPPGRDPIYEGKHSPHLVLALFSAVLAKAQPDWPANTVITGFPFYDGAADGTSLPPGLANFLSTGEPPIVFTLGSAAVIDPGEFYRESAEAARLLNRRAVLLVGQNAPPPSLPENVVAFGYVPFSGIFARATAVAHQGGVGTTGQALRAGCPMLVMPYGFDQADNAARLTRLGVGRAISRGAYTASRVAREFNVLLGNEKYRRAAAQLSETVRREQGADRACNALEKLLLKF